MCQQPHISFLFFRLPSLFSNRTTTACLCCLIFFPCSNAAKVWHHSGTKVPFLHCVGRRRWRGGNGMQTLHSEHWAQAQNVFLFYLKIITFLLLVALPKSCTAVLNTDPDNYSGLGLSLQYFRTERLGSLNGPQHKPRWLNTKTSLLARVFFFSSFLSFISSMNNFFCVPQRASFKFFVFFIFSGHLGSLLK